ncbi:MAG: class I SAM-dependent RNA methyltransferase [Pseudomonadota bacterium]
MDHFTINRLGARGEGIVQNGAEEIYVPFALPGEVIAGGVSADRIEKPKIVTPSELRVSPKCKHFKTCGGCRLQHYNPDALAAWKGALISDALEKFNLKTEIKPTHTSPPNSRRRATLSGRRSKSGTVIGFHGAASDQIIDIQECPILDPRILDGWPVYDMLVIKGASRKGSIKLAVTVSDTGLDISVSDAKPLSAQENQYISMFCVDKQVARLVWNGEMAFQSTPPTITLDGIQLRLVAHGFLQATEFGQNALIDTVRGIVRDKRTTVDLFSGMGTFSLPLAKTRAFHAVEHGRDMLSALQATANQASDLYPITTEHRDLFRRPLMPDELNKFDSLVIDPPRAGALAQCHEIAKSKIDTIAFVSCNPATFARDARVLVDAGFSLNWVLPIDQFLWSPHVELAAEFTR